MGMIVAPYRNASSFTDWRLFVDDVQGGTSLMLGEVEFYDASGLVATTGGTILFSTQGGGAATNAFDGNQSTNFETTSGQNTNQYIGYSWASGKNITRVAFVCPFSPTKGPKNGRLQYKVGGVWTDLVVFNIPSALTSEWISFPTATKVTRYHKVVINNNFDAWPSVQISELQFRATSGGSRLAGTLTGTKVFSTNTGALANDSNFSTNYVTDGALGRPCELTLDQGSGNANEVVEIAIAPNGAALMYAPSDFTVFYSADNVRWFRDWAVTGLSNTYAASTYRVFTR